MSVVRTYCKKHPSGTGFFVETEKDGVPSAVTTTNLTTAALAFDESKAEQIAALAGLTIQGWIITTNAI